MDAIRRRYKASAKVLDISAIRSSDKHRKARVASRSTLTMDAIRTHADALGRGEPTVSPAKQRAHRG